MKNKTSKASTIAGVVAIVIGLILIVVGALIPSGATENDLDKLAFSRSFVNYSCTITVTSARDYTVTSAVVYLEDFFEEEELRKDVSASKITKATVGEEFTYKFTIIFDNSDEYSKFSEIEKVVLNTSAGTRIAATDDYERPVSVTSIFMIIGGLLVASFGSIILIKHSMGAKGIKRTLERHPNIEILLGEKPLISEEVKEQIERPKPEPKICEYCGTIGDAGATKCPSCGAHFTKK